MTPYNGTCEVFTSHVDVVLLDTVTFYVMFVPAGDN